MRVSFPLFFLTFATMRGTKRSYIEKVKQSIAPSLQKRPHPFVEMAEKACQSKKKKQGAADEPVAECPMLFLKVCIDY